MKIDDDLINKLSTLSRLQFKGEDLVHIKEDLSKMLEFVEKLNEVDTEGVEPLIHISDEVNRLRKDEVSSQYSQEEALKNAPSKDSYYFKVPKVIKP
ncbi:MAG: Asp-tRNA(Asn)/Glu-tRNA(Gln) amidotransferase subunit GatC [Flavobacteriales bacterium]|nr:Asp-tRNA(Asn)/Glu-tRNA(Gln) amidotransferase subunit GatC [Flavobacteriales bacterium]